MQRFTYLSAVALLTAVSAVACCQQAQAITLFGDTFDRPDNHDIDAVTTGITNNTGTTFGASAVYSQPWIDPNSAAPIFGAPDGNAANGGGQQILSNEYQLKYGLGTSNSFVNHNFTNASILSAGGFSVSLDVLGYNQATNGQGTAIAVGMSLAEAQSGHDAVDGNPAPIAKYTNALQDTPFTTGTVLSDFYFALRGNSTLAWGSGTGAPTFVTVAAKTGTISANFGVTSFAAGSPVTYEVFYNGASKGVGSFTWSAANSNYIGLDARDNTVMRVDNFTIDTIAPPPKPTLVVDRDTGNITLQNLTTSPLSITSYSIITTQGGFNQANWSKIQTQGIDTNDTWFTFTDPSSTTDLAEGTLGEYTIAATNPGNTDQINLGNAWRRSPFEDLAFELRNSAGDDVPALVSYVGHGGSPFQLGDLSLTNGIDSADWVILRNHLTSNVSTMSPIDRYFAGDLNSDGFVNEIDFRQFKTLYTAGNGAGSFEAMLASIPEPASTVLCLVAAIVLVRQRGLRRRTVVRAYLFAGALACLLGAQRAMAADVFFDTFNRADSRNIDASLTGITDNTGSSLPADGVYTHAYIDPNNAPPTYGVQDGDALNGGGAQILTNQLQLATGAGTSNAYVNHNFTNSAITAAKGFRVSVNVTGYNEATTGQGGAFAIGMSAAQAASTGDAFGGHAVGQVGFGPKMQDAFENSGTASEGTAVSDFWVALTGSNNLIWGGFGDENVHGTVNVGAKTGIIRADFVVNDFNGGTNVAYEVFHNNVSRGSGVFSWTGSNEDFIGLDARDNTGVSFEDFRIETVAGLTPQMLRLQVNTSSGAASVLGGGSNNALDYYEITSTGGGLVAGNFNGIRGDAGLPAGNGTGNGWEIGGANSSSSLTEAFLTGQSSITAGTAAIPIGSVYNTATNAHDLQFTYFSNDGVSHLGFVEYVSSSVPDFNGNGVVDGADYVVWRKNSGLTGGATLAKGDANGDGNVNAADYTLWRASFGAPAGSGAGSLGGGTVPEPSAAALLLIAVILSVAARTRRRLAANLN